MKIAICDDDFFQCSNIENIILNYSKTINHGIDVEVFYNGKRFLESLQYECIYDLIFLDIELGTTTGLIVGNQIRNKLGDFTSRIVFISAKNGYDQDLFELNPLNFLRKPFSSEKITKCIDIVMNVLGQEMNKFHYNIGKEYKQLFVKDILYFKSQIRKLQIVTINDSEVFYGTLDKIKGRLPNTFIRVHGSYIVNFNHISKIYSDLITMNNGDQIPISKINAKELHCLQFKHMKELRDVNI